MYIYCLAHVLLAYYPPAPPGLPPLCPRNAWTLSSRQRQIQTQCKKANTNGPLLHRHHLLFVLCYNVHLRPIKIGEAYLITPCRPLALALDLKRQQWPTTSRSEQRDAIAGERDHFCLASTKLKRWLVDRHTSLSTRLWREVFSFGTLCLSLLIWDLALCLIPIFFIHTNV